MVRHKQIFIILIHVPRVFYYIYYNQKAQLSQKCLFT